MQFLVGFVSLGTLNSGAEVSLYKQHLQDASSNAPLLSEASKEAKKKFGALPGSSGILHPVWGRGVYSNKWLQQVEPYPGPGGRMSWAVTRPILRERDQSIFSGL